MYGETEGGREELFCCYLVVFNVTTHLGRVATYREISSPRFAELHFEESSFVIEK